MNFRYSERKERKSVKSRFKMSAQSKIETPNEVQELKKHLRKTYECLDEIILGRKELLVIFSKERKELDKLANDVQICKVSGGVAGTVGTGLVIGGFVASFFTFGASLIVSGVGAGVGASGAIVASSASIADAVISKKKRNIINNLLEKDAEINKKFECCYENLKIAFEVFCLAKTVFLFSRTIVTNAIRLLRVDDVAVDAGRTAFGASKNFAIAGVVFSIITLPLDIHMIVTNSVAIHKGDKHEISKDLHKFEDDIRKELVSLEAMKAEFDSTKNTIDTL